MREGIADGKLGGVGRLTLVLGAIMALGPLALDMYLPALPMLEAEFAATPARVQHTVSAYLLGMALGQFAMGPLSDRFGRKPPLLGGLFLFAVASAGCALAQHIEGLVLLRFAQALGGSSIMVVVRAVIRDRFDAIQSAQVLSLMMLVMGAAPILAPLAGGWLLIAASWHWIFWLLAAYALFCIATAFFLLDESHPVHARSVSIGGALAAMLPLARHRLFVGPALVFMFSFGAFFSYLAAAPFVFIQYFGVPAERFGIYFGVNAFGFIMVSQLNRRLVHGRGPRKVLGWGVTTLAAAAALLLASALTGVGGFAAVFAALFFVVASLGLIASNVSAVAMAPFGDRAGGAASLLGFSQALTGVVASAAVGWIPGEGALAMASVVAVCAAVSLVSYLTLVRSDRVRPASPP
ncbi:MAG TPA: multidrug effflux MFS transporter [Burkholderiales bacterium]|nr:multidrug effflux MFS transporter [Burkholderiales bacterium]